MPRWFSGGSTADAFRDVVTICISCLLLSRHADAATRLRNPHRPARLIPDHHLRLRLARQRLRGTFPVAIRSLARGRTMDATEIEVLEALRAHAVQSNSRGNWAEVNPWNAYPDLTVNLNERGFHSVLRALEFSRCYVRIDHDRGLVKMV